MAVATEVVESELPDTIKAAILAAMPEGGELGVFVEGYGHEGGAYSNIGKLVVESVHIAKEPQPPTVVSLVPAIEPTEELQAEAAETPAPLTP